MRSFASLKRNRPSLHQLALIQRFQLRQSSSLPLINAASNSNRDTSNQENPLWGSFLKWASAITVGSGLGLLYWSHDKPLLSFADFASAESTVEDASSSSSSSVSAFFPKSALPQTPKYFFGDAYRRRVFFNYEKRMRLRSPPEKVFEYFASFRSPDGELLMKPADLMRAVVPVFPPSESNLVRDGYLGGERNPGELHCAPSKFFMLFDVDNDGLISFKEYIFFVTLLSIPESNFSVAFKLFDINNNGEIDKKEFKKVMALMRARNRQGAQHRDGLRTGLKVNGFVENGGLVEHFFGKEGNEHLQHDKFIKFMRDLHDEVCGVSLSDNMVEIIFHMFDSNRDGNLSSDEFVRVLYNRERDIAQPMQEDAQAQATYNQGLSSLCNIWLY
nr:isoform 2 of calcium uptake protein, mitochondrial [Quercus suber]